MVPLAVPSDGADSCPHPALEFVLHGIEPIRRNALEQVVSDDRSLTGPCPAFFIARVRVNLCA